MSPEPLLSQSAGAASTREGEAPSRDEVRRKINSLYDRAESDTGTFNATRAASVPRQRGNGGGARPQQAADPDLSALTRRWFDMARAKLGPTVPVSQPSGRTPARAPQPARPARSEERPARAQERPAQPLALEAPKAVPGVAGDRGASAPAATASLPELAAGSVAEPTVGTFPDLPSGSGSPTAAPDSWFDQSMWSTGPQPVIAENTAPWELPQAPAAQIPAPAPTMAMPTVESSSVGAYELGVPGEGAPTYGAGLAADATTSYATGVWADPAPAYPVGLPAEATTTTYGAGLPAVPAPAVPAPEFTAPEPMAPAFAAPAFAEPALATPTFAEPTFAAPAFTEPAFAAPAAVALAEPAVAATFAPAVPSWAGGHGTKAERVLAFARGQIGRPCVRGAVGPGSYDAPGLAQAAWKTAGVTLPRTTQAQAEYGMPIALADVQVGDLVFFHDDLGHVGVWAGNGMMIHAPGPGAQIREESVFFAGHAAIKGAVRPA